MIGFAQVRLVTAIAISACTTALATGSILFDEGYLLDFVVGAIAGHR